MASMSADLVTDCLVYLDEAHQNEMITDHSLVTMQTWLKEPRYDEFAEQLANHEAEESHSNTQARHHLRERLHCSFAY